MLVQNWFPLSRHAEFQLSLHKTAVELFSTFVVSSSLNVTAFASCEHWCLQVHHWAERCLDGPLSVPFSHLLPACCWPNQHQMHEGKSHLSQRFECAELLCF